MNTTTAHREHHLLATSLEVKKELASGSSTSSTLWIPLGYFTNRFEARGKQAS
jgi:hypothetical protein